MFFHVHFYIESNSEIKTGRVLKLMREKRLMGLDRLSQIIIWPNGFD